MTELEKRLIEAMERLIGAVEDAPDEGLTDWIDEEIERAREVLGDARLEQCRPSKMRVRDAENRLVALDKVIARGDLRP